MFVILKHKDCIFDFASISIWKIINAEMLRFDKWYKISVNTSSLREILEPDNIKGNYTAWNSDLRREYK